MCPRRKETVTESIISINNLSNTQQEMEPEFVLVAWVPYAVLCLTAFVVVLVKSIKLIAHSRKVKRTPTLMIIYISVNLAIICIMPQPLIIIFPDDRIVYWICTLTGIVESISLTSAILVFLSRVADWLLHLVPQKKCLFRVLFYACWTALVMHILAAPWVSLMPRKAPFYAYTLFMDFVILAFEAVIFFMFARELRRASGEGIFHREKLLSAYFCVQIAGEILNLVLSAAVLVGKPDSEKASTYALGVVAVYTLTIIDNILPPVLIFAMISRKSNSLSLSHPEEEGTAAAATTARLTDDANAIRDERNVA